MANLSPGEGSSEEAEALRVRLAQLERAIESGGLGLFNWSPITGEVAWSTRLCTIFGYDPATFPGTLDAVISRIHPDDRDDVLGAMTNALETGEVSPRQFRVLLPGGEVRWVDGSTSVFFGPDGRAERLVGLVADISDRRFADIFRAHLFETERSARVEAEAARERLRLLATAGAELNAVLDPQTVVERFARVLVPAMGTFCSVDLVDEDGTLRPAAFAHEDPEKLATLRSARTFRSERQVRAWAHDVIMEGRSVLLSPVTPRDVEMVAAGEQHLEVMRALDPTSVMVLALRARGRVVGGMTLCRTGGALFSREDLIFAESLASRAATAIDNALVLADREQVMRTLQLALLPPTLPKIPGVDLAARYHAADSTLDVGGDLYDVFERPDDTWAVVIGDVCGKGAGSAARTGLFRHTIRAVALHEAGPAKVLALTNQALLDQADDGRFVTAVYGTLRPDPDRLRIALSIAGHPRPVVLRANGQIEPVSCEGALLGVLPDPPLAETEVELGPGDALVLYTDGVTEARDQHGRFEDRLLLEVLAGAARASADELADRLVEAVLAYQSGEAADDVAVVVIALADSTAR